MAAAAIRTAEPEPSGPERQRGPGDPITGAGVLDFPNVAYAGPKYFHSAWKVRGFEARGRVTVQGNELVFQAPTHGFRLGGLHGVERVAVIVRWKVLLLVAPAIGAMLLFPAVDIRILLYALFALVVVVVGWRTAPKWVLVDGLNAAGAPQRAFFLVGSYFWRGNVIRETDRLHQALQAAMKSPPQGTVQRRTPPGPKPTFRPFGSRIHRRP